MSASAFSIIGLDELNMLFAQFPNAFGKMFANAGSQYANSIYDQSYRIVPVKTGYLRSTIGATVNTREIRVYATAPYAAAVHDGARGRPARPFLWNPAMLYLDKFVNDLADQVIMYFSKGGKSVGR